MKLLVTGATGHFGGLVVEHLLKTIEGKDITVSVRNPEKARSLAERGVDVREGDFDKPETLAKAFKGIDKMLLISTDLDNETRIRQHLQAIASAKAAGVKHLIYTSLAKAPQSSLSLAEVHQVTEKAILDSGLKYTILRNNWYLENELSNIKAVASGAPWITSAEDGKVGWTLRREYAEAAAKVLSSQGHENKIYELSSPAHTQKDLAKATGNALNLEVKLLNVSDKAYAEGLKSANLPEFLIELFTDIQKSIRENALDVEISDLETLLGRKPLSLEAAVAELAKTL